MRSALEARVHAEFGVVAGVRRELDVLQKHHHREAGNVALAGNDVDSGGIERLVLEVHDARIVSVFQVDRDPHIADVVLGTRGQGLIPLIFDEAVARVEVGRDPLNAANVLVIGYQPPNESRDWRTVGNQAVRTETLRLADKYQDIIIDTGGRDTTSQRAALTVSDILLAPFQPSSFDLWSLEQTELLYTEMQPANAKLKGYTFLDGYLLDSGDHKM